ncbi:MAG: TonB-dependent receptor [Acidobacteriia bacterium]|nr:TonB-dependent receptor [Terriglobia bacterium]
MLNSTRLFGRSFLAVAVFSVWVGVLSARAETAGAVAGHVVDQDGRPVASVTALLKNDIAGFKDAAVTAKDGSFKFFNVPFNPYELHVEVQGFKTVHQHIEVRSIVAVNVTVRLEVAPVTASVTVEAEPTAVQLETDTSMSHLDIDKSYIARAPATVSGRAMEQIITATPGFAKDENGRFHFQGAHSQSEYVIDGQIISDQTGITFSNSIDPGIAQAIEVIYGNVPAEFGEKIGAVINLTTKSGLGSGGVRGEAFVGASRFSTAEGGASVGYGTDSFGLFASVNGSKSDHFVDPVNFDSLHNEGNTGRGFVRLDWAPDPSNTVRLTMLAGRTNRDVPNTYTQLAAGQAQRVFTRDANYNLGYQGVLSSNAVLDVSGFARLSTFELQSSPGDTPVQAMSNRSLDNYGLAPSITWATGVHEVKLGGEIKRFPIEETFTVGITDPTLNDPTSPDYNPSLAPYDLTRGGIPFLFHARRTGTYYAGYLQDNIRLGNFTANLGVRYDHNDLPLSEAQLEPRIGAIYYFPETKTALRVSYNRVLYTPEYENILLSSSPEAAALAPPPIQESRALGGGDLLVHSERQNAVTVGVQQAIGSKVRVDVDFWERRSTYAGDQDQLFNTGIVFPLAFSSGRLHGWDLRLDFAQTAGFRGFLSLGHTRAVYVAPPVGGLFLDASIVDSLTGGPFLIDHDQNLQLQSGVTYDLGATGAWFGANVRYDSGLVSGAAPDDLVGDPDNSWAIPYIRVTDNSALNPDRIKSRTIWDFSVGADLTRYHIPFSVQLDLLNAFDWKGVYNILSIMGGTHVIPPRTLAVRVKYVF